MKRLSHLSARKFLLTPFSNQARRVTPRDHRVKKRKRAAKVRITTPRKNVAEKKSNSKGRLLHT